MQIEDLNPTITNPDSTVSIADLAKFVSFNPRDARKFSTSIPCIAFAALEAEYGNHEMVAGESDYYDGMFMEFSDGSILEIEG